MQKYNTPHVPGQTVVRNLSIGGAFTFKPEFMDDESMQASPIIQLETRLERFVVADKFDPRSMPHLMWDEKVRAVKDGLEYMFRNRIARFGLLIPDSMEFSEDRTAYYEDKLFVLKLSGNVLMPTFDGAMRYIPDIPRQRCSYCGTMAFEDQFHSGTCENCGGQFK